MNTQFANMNNHISRVKIIQQANRSTILKLIRGKSIISRADIAKTMGLTRSAASTIVSHLIGLGYVMDIGEGESSGGKKPILVGIRKNSFYAIGIDLGESFHIRGVLCNLNGDIVLRKEITYKNQFPDILEKTAMIIEGLKAKITGKRIKGIGISASGIVDFQKQEIIRAAYFDTTNRGLVRHLAERFSLPIFLENNAKSASMAEKQLGVGTAYENLLYFNIDRGIGLGIIIDGKIYYGAFGGSGEIGRSIHYPDPQKTEFPPSSHLENRMSEQNIIETVGRMKGAPVPYRRIIQMYREGDGEIRTLFDELAEHLAYTVAVVANAFNPEAIILGGRINEFPERFFDFFRKRLHLYLEPQFIEKTHILLSKFGLDAPALGGAVVVINKIFDLEL